MTECSKGLMKPYAARLKALREELGRRQLDGIVLPVRDQNICEHIRASADRVEWLSGFQGSAGMVVVLKDGAAIFVDGRYTLQVREQVDVRIWECRHLAHASVEAWLLQRTKAGWRIGYDPWLHSRAWVLAVRRELEHAHAEFVAVDTNPIDAVWLEKNCSSGAKLFAYPEAMAGKCSVEKVREIAAWLNGLGASSLVLTALDSIAWTFNIRGGDVEHTPVASAYAVVNADATADLFVAPEKVSQEIVAHLGNSVRIHQYDAFIKHLSALGDKKIVVDPHRTVAAILDALNGTGSSILELRDPTVLWKAIKNKAEILGHRAAQVRDGIVLCRFLHWLSTVVSSDSVTEFSAAAFLHELRSATGKLCDLAFPTISAYGPNGAVIHYHASVQSSLKLEPGSLYLIDSGAQYMDGTTDVTRTIAIGTPTAEMRDRFTRVLKGHIALASSVFPQGTCGGQLDTLARQYLWRGGLDYEHATGHGVGAYLNVHEGPQRIGNQTVLVGGDEPLVPGMILSNEPGYYKKGEYGIRIENLVLVTKREIPGAEQEMLAFETLTYAPIDRALIDEKMLTAPERDWINSYHRQIFMSIGQGLDSKERAWLCKATEPLN
jgi:Xaa-Pro aminopeptidase